MIVVLADDLSGAAELAGAALAHGLTAEVQTEFEPVSQAKVVCVDTDSRSLPSTEAARVVGDIARRVVMARPEWIYKKCDSVLRGNVLAEIRAIMTATGQTRAVLLSANPTRGRIIRGGDCFVNGELLHTTSFANDPEHPRLTSRVIEMLGGNLTGINTPDAETTADLERHAATVGTNVLPAGGVEFFSALLRSGAADGEHSRPGCGSVRPRAEPERHPTPEAGQAARARPAAPGAGALPVTSLSGVPESIGTNDRQGATLMICGSAAAWAKGRAAQCAARGIVVKPMPPELFAIPADASAIAAWAERITYVLQSGRNVMAAIGRAELHPNPALLAKLLTSAVAAAVRQAKPSVICAEGGATAAALARALDWRRFNVMRQLAGGVVELRPIAAAAPAFVIKVGSYDWPEGAWPVGSP